MGNDGSAYCSSDSISHYSTLERWSLKITTEAKFMKITKPLIITALVVGNLLAWNLALHAQNATTTPPPAPTAARSQPGGPGMNGQSNSDMLTQELDSIAQELNLTDDQKPKLRFIMESRMQKMGDLRQNPGFAGMSPEDRAAKVKAIQDEAETQMKALLTPEQSEKLQEDSRRKDQIINSLSRSEEHTSELQSPCNLVCRLLLEKKK